MLLEQAKSSPSQTCRIAIFSRAQSKSPSVSSMIPRSVSAVSKGERKEGSRDVVGAPPAKP